MKLESIELRAGCASASRRGGKAEGALAASASKAASQLARLKAGALPLCFGDTNIFGVLN